MRRHSWFAFVASVAFVLALGVVSNAVANALQAQLHVGRLWTSTENDGSEAPDAIWPGGLATLNKYGDGTSQEIKRGWMNNIHKQGNYLFTMNWTDPDAVTWQYAGSYKFRTDNGDWPTSYTSTSTKGQFNWVYPISQQEILRWDRPKVIIATPDTLLDFIFFPGSAGLDEFNYPASGGRGPRADPIIDPNLITEEMTHNVWRYIEGVELWRDTYVYPYGTQSQDYYLEDIHLINNGVSGRTPSEHPPGPVEPPVLTDQVLNNVLWARATDFVTNSEGVASSQTGMDQECMFIEPWGAGAHSAAASWDLDDQSDGGNPGPDWGDPGENSWYENLLVGSAYSLYGPLFVSTDGGTNKAVDDQTQPIINDIWYEKAFDLAGVDYSPTTVQSQREYLADGGLALDLNTSFLDNPVTAVVTSTAHGPVAIQGYGAKNGELSLANVPNQGWTMNWLDTVRIVTCTAVSGIDQEEGRRIGKIWNDAITANGVGTMSADDIALVQTGQDSMMKAAAMAYWNYYGAFASNVTGTETAAWNIGDIPASKPAAHGAFDMVDPPRPPDFISVRPNSQGGVEVRWGKAAETTPNHDSGVQDVVGYRVYRQSLSRLAPWETLHEGLIASYGERAAITDSLPAGRFYIDTTAVVGQDYWYCVVAYDDGTSNWEQPGKSLESTRWWTWTGYYNVGVTALAPWVDVKQTARPSAISLRQNTPNPFNPTTTIGYTVDRAMTVSLVVYNLNGQVVRTLVDGRVAAGPHEAVWDGSDATGRDVASGVYVYRMNAGDQTFVRRMLLVR